MIVFYSLLCFQSARPGVWGLNWAWGLPLIVLTVVIHVLGLGLMNLRAQRTFTTAKQRPHDPFAVFVLVMGTMTLFATCLHAAEAGIWAFAYEFLGARSDYKSAMLYSLGAMTTYGHSGLFLEERWQLLGSIEALGGWLVFGLTTAFLFGMIQKVWGLIGMNDSSPSRMA